jgi:hypothetical protein
MRERLNRRHVMTALAALGIAGSAAPASLAPDRSGSRLTARLVKDPDAARRIGRAYLRGFGQSGDLTHLAQRIRRRLGLEHPALAADPARLRARIEAAVRDDFAHYNTDTVGGWVLARTELELCALVALES